MPQHIVLKEHGVPRDCGKEEERRLFTAFLAARLAGWLVLAVSIPAAAILLRVIH